MSRKPASDQPALWPAPVPDPPAVAEGDSTRAVTAQTIVGEWLDRCRRRPPRQVVGQVAKHIREMLTEGIDPDDIRRGTAAWMAKGLHPAALPSVVNEVMNRGPLPPTDRPSTTDARVAATLALGAKLQAAHEREAVGR
ncbi:hypothetical protein [Micromonospora sp. NPDC004551]|uniref:hypothetical protein n=1 Tax=Micromonospora sp. NPDC004551 TaxID=3154284 RepID=UPI0033B69986